MNKPVTATEVMESREALPQPIAAAAFLEPVVDAFVVVLERLARDPNTDVEKVERFMALKVEEDKRRAERAFNVALRKCQEEMTPVSANAQNPQTRSKYADYHQLDKAVRQIYTSNGFAVTFSTADAVAGPDYLKVICWLLHEDGHSKQYEMTVPADGKGPKGQDVMSKTHATGSANAYGKRYLLSDIFNLSVDKDDDGNGASVNDSQTEDLFALLKASGVTADAFCERYKIESVADLPRKLFAAAKASLELTVKDRKAPDYLK